VLLLANALETMLTHSLHTLLRYTHRGYTIARRIVLGLACCMLLLYGVQELSASEATAEKATVQCPHAEPAQAPAVPMAPEAKTWRPDVPPVPSFF